MIPAPDGYQYGVLFSDGGVASPWNGRTQRKHAEAYSAYLREHYGLRGFEYPVVRRLPGGPWEPIQDA